MERTLLLTADGSHTISVPDRQLTYHSRHGAIQESQHVFLEAGFNYAVSQLQSPALRVLEIGFGTGLNALLTLIAAEDLRLKVHYTTLEPYPLEPGTTEHLNYADQLNRPGLSTSFQLMHACDWDQDIRISDHFTFKKLRDTMLDFPVMGGFQVIYFDAFAPTAQPDMWTVESFQHLLPQLSPGAPLVTYCSKADVRRAMVAAGFTVTKIPGPWGKREMVRALRPR